jgi:hypothetical protein
MTEILMRSRYCDRLARSDGVVPLGVTEQPSPHHYRHQQLHIYAYAAVAEKERRTNLQCTKAACNFDVLLCSTADTARSTRLPN